MAEKSRKYHVAVVGGINIDIGGRSRSPLVQGDSNPGSIGITPGGVGRNIAENLCRLGFNVTMLTAIGADYPGSILKISCEELGIDLSHALLLDDASTSTYMYIAGSSGDMVLAVNDMEICNRITPNYISENLEFINSCDAAVADANIPQETLEFLAEHCTIPLICDPVSASKAPRVISALRGIHTLKPNRLEAQLLTGINIEDPDSAAAAAEALLKTGVKRVFLTLGSKGVVAADCSGTIFLPCSSCKPIDATGCGDSFTAALVYALLEGFDLAASAQLGMEAARITMQAPGAVSENISEILKSSR